MKKKSFLLKNLSNFFIGSWSSDPIKFRNQVLLHKTDLSTINFNQFQGSESISENYCIGHFKNSGIHTNLSHLNFNLIMMGRLKYLQTVCTLTSCLRDCHFNMGNTDGMSILLASVPQITHDISLPDLLNQFLRADLSMSKLIEYKSFLIHDVGLNVCPKHEGVYLDHLKNSPKTIWKCDSLCCSSLPIKDHRLRLEGYGENAIIFKKNQAYFFNEMTNQPKTKASGIQNANFHSFYAKCESDEERSVCQRINRLSHEFHDKVDTQSTFK